MERKETIQKMIRGGGIGETRTWEERTVQIAFQVAAVGCVVFTFFSITTMIPSVNMTFHTDAFLGMGS